MIYLDNASTTRVRDEVFDAMTPYLTATYGNPSSVHRAGREARRALDEAREMFASAIGARPNEIIFTGSGTESDNTAIKGSIPRARAGVEMITTRAEHHAVLNSAQTVHKAGVRNVFVKLNSDGLVDLDDLRAKCNSLTALVTIMLVNNEVGVVQPLPEIAEVVKAQSRAVIHTDAVQALGKVPVSVAALGADMAAFSAHKLGGPKGAGALWVKSRTSLAPLIDGGGQEVGLRSGTTNVAGCVGLAVAARLAADELKECSARLASLRDRLESKVKLSIPGATINCADAPRSPAISNISFAGAESEPVLLMLDERGIAVSSGSACTSGAVEPSHVLKAIGLSDARARTSIRISVGRETTEDEVDTFVGAAADVVTRLRERQAALR